VRLRALTGAVNIDRAFRVAAVGATLLFCATPGSSAPNRVKERRRACAVARKNALELERNAHLREAKDLLLGCTKAECGSPLKEECKARYSQLDSDIPTVVPLVTDDGAAPHVDVEVLVDGDVLTKQLDGRSFPIDPGLHRFSFSTERGVFAMRSVFVTQGEHDRPISVPLHPPAGIGAKTVFENRDMGVDKKDAAIEDSKPKPSVERPKPAAERPKIASKPEESFPESPPLRSGSSGGSSAAAYLFGGLTLAGAGGYALLTAWGRSDNRLLSGCAPYCKESNVDHIKKLYLAADASLAVGAIGAIGFVTWLVVHPRGSKEDAAGRAGYLIDVQPRPSGAYASVSGSF
jgi:hypothetical protein